MPRSGTSWLGKIFDRHPRVLYRHEPDSEYRVGAPPYICAAADLPRQLEAARVFLDRVAQVRTSKSAGSLPYFRKDYRSALIDKLRLGIVFAIKGAERFKIMPLNPQDVVIPDLLDRGRPDALVMKSIEAIGRVNLYRAAWSDCRVIVIVRHPCGQICSTLEGINRHKFTSRTPIYDDEGLLGALAETDQAKRRGLTTARLVAMSPVERLSWMWALPNEKAMDDIAGDANAMTVRYDGLCASPLSVAKELFAFAGISWHPAVEEFIRASTDPAHAKSDSYYSVFRDPESAVDRWRTALSAADIATIRDSIGDTAPGRLFEYS